MSLPPRGNASAGSFPAGPAECQIVPARGGLEASARGEEVLRASRRRSRRAACPRAVEEHPQVARGDPERAHTSSVSRPSMACIVNARAICAGIRPRCSENAPQKRFRAAAYSGSNSAATARPRRRPRADRGRSGGRCRPRRARRRRAARAQRRRYSSRILCLRMPISQVRVPLRPSKRPCANERRGERLLHRVVGGDRVPQLLERIAVEVLAVRGDVGGEELGFESHGSSLSRSGFGSMDGGGGSAAAASSIRKRTAPAERARTCGRQRSGCARQLRSCSATRRAPGLAARTRDVRRSGKHRAGERHRPGRAARNEIRDGEARDLAERARRRRRARRPGRRRRGRAARGRTAAARRRGEREERGELELVLGGGAHGVARGGGRKWSWCAADRQPGRQSPPRASRRRIAPRRTRCRRGRNASPARFRARGRRWRRTRRVPPESGTPATARPRTARAPRRPGARSRRRSPPPPTRSLAESPKSRVSVVFTFAPVLCVSMERIVLRGARRRYPEPARRCVVAAAEGVVVST